MKGESFYVLADSGAQSLAFGPSHFSGSAQPGASGTSVIAAHRNTHFKPLQHIQLGDVVEIERPDGISHSYKIRRTRVLENAHLILPAQDGRDRVILVTCWPFDSTSINPKQRLAVLAERI
jgi:sortase A